MGEAGTNPVLLAPNDASALCFWAAVRDPKGGSVSRPECEADGDSVSFVVGRLGLVR